MAVNVDWYLCEYNLHQEGPETCFPCERGLAGVPTHTEPNGIRTIFHVLRYALCERKYIPHYL